MKNKVIPSRMCVVCRQRCPKSELIRVVKNKNGEISLDESFKAEGRGAYICKNCVDKLIKTRALNRAYKCDVSNELYNEILCKIKGDNK